MSLRGPKSESKAKKTRKKQTLDRSARRRRLTEVLETLRARAQLIEQELGEYTKGHFRVCIFGSARIESDDEIYKLTHRLGRLLGEEGIDVLTGGGPGLMEAASKGVTEGKKASGSKSRSFGLTIELNLHEPSPSEHLDIKRHHKRFSSRLDDFMRLSNAIIVVRGGIGTLLELVFSWQLLQVGHLSDRPIILMDSGFWEGLIAWMKEKQMENGLIGPQDLRWIHMVDTPEEAMKIILEEHQKFLGCLEAMGLKSRRDKKE